MGFKWVDRDGVATLADDKGRTYARLQHTGEAEICRPTDGATLARLRLSPHRGLADLRAKVQREAARAARVVIPAEIPIEGQLAPAPASAPDHAGGAGGAGGGPGEPGQPGQPGTGLGGAGGAGGAGGEFRGGSGSLGGTPDV